MELRRRIRETLGLSQSEMAQRLGVASQGAVSHYELGKRQIDIHVARRYLTMAAEAGIATDLDAIFGPSDGQSEAA